MGGVSARFIGQDHGKTRCFDPGICPSRDFLEFCVFKKGRFDVSWISRDRSLLVLAVLNGD